jgi:hypothetical protein
MFRNVCWERFICLCGLAMAAASSFALSRLARVTRQGVYYYDTWPPASFYECLLVVGIAAAVLGGIGWYLAYFPLRLPKWQISMSSLLLLLGALPIWLVLFIIVPMSSGFGGSNFRYVVAPLVLGGATWALHILFRKWRDGWAISALLAAMICFGTLSIAAWLAD